MPRRSLGSRAFPASASAPSLPRPENEKARRTLPAGFTGMRVNVEPSGRPVGCVLHHTTTGHRACEGRGGEPTGYGQTHNHTVTLAARGGLVNSGNAGGAGSLRCTQ